MNLSNIKIYLFSILYLFEFANCNDDQLHMQHLLRSINHAQGYLEREKISLIDIRWANSKLQTAEACAKKIDNFLKSQQNKIIISKSAAFYSVLVIATITYIISENIKATPKQTLSIPLEKNN